MLGCRHERTQRMSIELSVRLGDITRQPDCDGIVNSANGNLRAGSGVCGAIHATAGPELEVASHRQAPLEIGCSVSTPGYRLPNRTVIHTRGPRYHFDADPPNQLIAAVETALLAADAEQVSRLAIPAISMGVYAYPPEEAVPLLVRTCRYVAPRLNHVQEVRFVVTNDQLLHLFQEEIDRPPGPDPWSEPSDPYGIPAFLIPATGSQVPTAVIAGLIGSTAGNRAKQTLAQSDPRVLLGQSRPWACGPSRAAMQR